MVKRPIKKWSGIDPEPEDQDFPDVDGDTLTVGVDTSADGVRYAILDLSDENPVLHYTGAQLDGLIEHLCVVRAWVG